MTPTKLTVIGPRSCRSCFLHGPCAGISGDNDVMFGCSSQCCGRADCDYPCLSKPNLADYVREVRGIDNRTPRLPALATPLPPYLPVVRRNVTGIDLLEEPYVAITFDDFFRGRRRNYRPLAENGRDLRARLGLHPTTRLILLGVARDRTIERFWRQRKIRDIAQHLAALGLEFVTCPNYSFFRDAPRFATLWNRHRMICVMEELADAGVRVSPHLNALDDDDWAYWLRLLRMNPDVSIVTKEFQTGARDPERAAQAQRGLLRLQEDLGRPLHVLAVGGARLAGSLALQGTRATIIDSTPFMKTIKRKRLADDGRWRAHPTAANEPLTALLIGNIDGYRARVINEIALARAASQPAPGLERRVRRAS